VLLIYLLEIGAAVSGTIYLNRISTSPPGVRLIVIYLWFVVFVEGVGLYPAYAYYSDYSRLGFIEGTLFERNYWWFNSYNVVKMIFLSYFFIRQFVSLRKKRVFYFITWILAVTFIADLVYSDTFFTHYPLYTAVMGAFYLITLILMYHKDLVESDRILDFHNNIVFYISIAMLLWHTMVTPLLIYSKYFSRTSPEFVALHSIILQWANVLLYGIIILGFWVCQKNQKREEKVLR